MPSYTKMSIAELRQVCEENGIDHEGLTKKRTIEALRKYDRGQIDIELGDEQRAEDRDNEAEFGGVDQGQAQDSGSVDGSSTSSTAEVAELMSRSFSYDCSWLWWKLRKRPG